MTMFTELYALATTATLSMVVSADDKRGTLTISVMPKPKKDVGEPALTKDLTLTATPAEFDGGFVEALIGISRSARRVDRAGRGDQGSAGRCQGGRSEEGSRRDDEGNKTGRQAISHAAKHRRSG